jgi:predicted site-specific integrase-resolvase
VQATKKTADKGSIVVIDPVVSLREASKATNQSEWTLKRRAKAGKLKIIKLSANRNGIRASEVNRYLDALESR